MARKEVVSRKMPVTKVNVMCVDKEKGEVFTREVNIKGVPKSEKTFIRKVAKLVEDDSVKFVKIVDYSTTIKKAYIPMEQFLEICLWEEQ